MYILINIRQVHRQGKRQADGRLGQLLHDNGHALLIIFARQDIVGLDLRPIHMYVGGVFGQFPRFLGPRVQTNVLSTVGTLHPCVPVGGVILASALDDSPHDGLHFGPIVVTIFVLIRFNQNIIPYTVQIGVIVSHAARQATAAVTTDMSRRKRSRRGVMKIHMYGNIVPTPIRRARHVQGLMNVTDKVREKLNGIFVRGRGGEETTGKILNGPRDTHVRRAIPRPHKLGTILLIWTCLVANVNVMQRSGPRVPLGMTDRVGPIGHGPERTEGSRRRRVGQESVHGVLDVDRQQLPRQISYHFVTDFAPGVAKQCGLLLLTRSHQDDGSHGKDESLQRSNAGRGDFHGTIMSFKDKMDGWIMERIVWQSVWSL